MRRLVAPLAASLLACTWTTTVRADFHFMEINEVLLGIGGDASIQFVELQMTEPGQHVVGGHELFFFDAAGAEVGQFTLPGNVANTDPVGGILPHILIATARFECAFGVAPDFVMPDGLLQPGGGRVSFEGPPIDVSVDSVAYGAYTGSNTGAFINHGSPAPGQPIAGNQSLTRTAASGNNANDFTLQAPTPTNNARATAARTPPAQTCFFTDDFEDMSNWDKPTDNAGLDLTACGVPAQVDIGAVDVAGGKLVFTPGLADQLGLGAPIAFTGMKSSAVAAADFADENYRLRFNLVAHRGIAVGAVFVREHYAFDEDAATIDVSQAGGCGINFAFDELNGEGDNDHLHPDIRLACLSEGSAEGPRNVNYPDYVLMSETEYTLIIDVDGDDVNGPLTYQVKLYPADRPEPADYLATFKLAAGLGASGKDSLDRGVLIAALGVDVGAGQPTLEVSDFSICSIPLKDQHVRCLVCVRQGDGSVLATWNNPSGADETTPIRVLLNGEEVASVSGDSTQAVIQNPPAGDITLGVINYSCTPAECSLCDNDPPVVVIEGPSTAGFEGGAGAAQLDSAASSDPEMGEFTRFWEVVASPAGANPMIDDQLGVEINLTVDREGAYTVRLTLTDNGCPGDLDGAFATAEHTVTFSSGPEGTGPFVRGDCNGDRIVSGVVTDAVFMLNFNFLGGAEPPCFAACDANRDGAFRGVVTDAVYILNFNFLGGPRPPEPFPACGASAEASDIALGCLEPIVCQ